MIDPALASAFEATWPAVEYADAGGFRVGCGLGGGGRVSSAVALGPWTEADIGAAVAIHEGWGQRPLFRVMDGDALLMAALDARAFAREVPAAIMAAPVEALTDRPLPPLAAFDIWPPLAVQHEIWNEGGIGPARQAVMMRVQGAKTALLGRTSDRPAGAGFVAAHGPVAMIHMLHIAPALRRHGVAGHLIRAAGFWAAGQGAGRLALSVRRDNAAMLALCRRMGLRELGGYGYYARPQGWG